MTCVSSQQLAVSDQTVGLKIQVMAESWTGSKGLPWADMEKMPDFTTHEQAQRWMAENGCEKLQEYGLRFRIVPKDTPCEFTAQLEKNIVDSEED